MGIDWKSELEYLASASSVDYRIDPFVTNKHLVFYGAGNLGVMAYDFFKKSGIGIPLVVDKKKDKLVGVECRRIDKVSLEVRETYLWIVCISTVSYNEVVRDLRQAGVINIIQFYTMAFILNSRLLSNGWFFRKYEFDSNKAAKICSLLEHDEFSVAHYLQFLYWKKQNVERIYEGYPVASGKKYWRNSFMPALTSKESYMDMGCYLGAYIDEFADWVDKRFQSIIGIEPDPSVTKMLMQKYGENTKVKLVFKAVSNLNGKRGFSSGMGYANKLDEEGPVEIDTVSIDSLCQAPTIMKIHVEGEEYNTLCGALVTIKKSRPIVMVLADHSIDGYYSIPYFVSNLVRYKLFFRLHDYCGNSAVFYFMPEERLCNG